MSDRPFYRLNPVYRHGKDIPWGGNGLKTLLGKPIPDDHTGEALEASTLPGLESTTDDGRTLTEIAGGPLPLLLKLIDAHAPLSVQVHPDDDYAAQHENGKLGKTEAWLILHAEPGAQLVYGLLPGTDVLALSGKDIEAHLRWIEVQPGDALYIPAGMVHAIGGGIMLYEIQQCSDITYRFWDWDRRDEEGQPRALHWEAACDVARVDLQPKPHRGTERIVPGGAITEYLDTPYFSLIRLSVRGEMPLPERPGFQFLTAFGNGTLCKGAETLPLRKGETVFIPGGATNIVVRGTLDVVISAEGTAD